MEAETITLLIEDVPIKCNKQQLVDNSNYFKVMFEGNFAERYKSTVTLEEIELKSIKTILKLLEDQSNDAVLLNDDDEVLTVLLTASILQFESAQETCLHILTERLNTHNCIKLWQACESHSIYPLCLKAKNLALIEYNVLKYTTAFHELNLPQLYAYLANVMLQNRCELDVFVSCMDWYYENGECDANIIIKLLGCIDFCTATEDEIREMRIMPDVAESKTLQQLLSGILSLKVDKGIDRAFPSNEDQEPDTSLFHEARILLNSNRRRKSCVDPVLFVKRYLNKAQSEDRLCEAGEENVDIAYDQYKRKRKYMRIGGVEESEAGLFIYDMIRQRYIKCVEVPQEKYVGCEGFHIAGYKEQIFFFGGEVTIGSGHWNLNFWVYDTIRERWERKTRLPSGRRHFQSCICGSYLYIIGGTGSFRIIQDNMFWYNYLDNIWSTQLILPCPSGQLRCCNFNNQLLLLNVSNKCGYIFCNKRNSFVKLDFYDEHNLVRSYPPHFSLFSYKDRVYLKGTSLIEFELLSNKLSVTNVRTLKENVITLAIQSNVMESVVCEDDVFTVYKCSQSKTIYIGKTSMLRGDNFASVLLPSEVEEGFNIDSATKLFTLQHHYKMADGDTYVNDFNEFSESCQHLKC